MSPYNWFLVYYCIAFSFQFDIQHSSSYRFGPFRVCPYDFEDLEEVQFALGRMADLEMPLVTTLPRQPGQKEERHVHLLSGQPEIPLQSPAPASSGGLAARVSELEAAVESLETRLSALESKEENT